MAKMALKDREIIHILRIREFPPSRISILRCMYQRKNTCMLMVCSHRLTMKCWFEEKLVLRVESEKWL